MLEPSNCFDRAAVHGEQEIARPHHRAIAKMNTDDFCVEPGLDRYAGDRRDRAEQIDADRHFLLHRDGDIDRNDAGCGLLGRLSDGAHRSPIALLHGKDAAQGQYHDNPDKQIPFIHASAGPDGIAQPRLPLYVAPRS
jgi:hypothetical protein